MANKKKKLHGLKARARKAKKRPPSEKPELLSDVLPRVLADLKAKQFEDDAKRASRLAKKNSQKKQTPKPGSAAWVKMMNDARKRALKKRQTK